MERYISWSKNPYCKSNLGKMRLFLSFCLSLPCFLMLFFWGLGPASTPFPSPDVFFLVPMDCCWKYMPLEVEFHPHLQHLPIWYTYTNSIQFVEARGTAFTCLLWFADIVGEASNYTATEIRPWYRAEYTAKPIYRYQTSLTLVTTCRSVNSHDLQIKTAFHGGVSCQSWFWSLIFFAQ